MITRYRAAPNGGHVESPTGDVVMYADHQAEIAELLEQLSQQMKSGSDKAEAVNEERDRAA